MASGKNSFNRAVGSNLKEPMSVPQQVDVASEPMKVAVSVWLSEDQRQPMKIPMPSRSTEQPPQSLQTPKSPAFEPNVRPQRRFSNSSGSTKSTNCPTPSPPNSERNSPRSNSSSCSAAASSNAAFFAAPQGQDQGGTNKWWTRSREPLMCPLTQFPISLLPYPPFKLRVDPEKPSPVKLVDGKYLAMRLIANGSVPECGRELTQEDVKNLDAYIHRCKLGPFRPGRAMAMVQEIATSTDHKEAMKSAQELCRMRAAARTELGRLRRIQENRLLQLKQQQAQQQARRSPSASY